MILDLLKSLVSPIVKIVDKAVPDKDKRSELQAHIKELEIEMGGKFLEYEVRLMQVQASVIEKEAGGESSLQRNWRPGAMVTFLVIIVYNMLAVPIFGLPPSSMETVPKELWTLMTIGIGGYIGVRSFEKIARNLKLKGKLGV